MAYRETGLGGYELHAAGCAHMMIGRFSRQWSPAASTIDAAIRDLEETRGIEVDVIASCARRLEK